MIWIFCLLRVFSTLLENQLEANGKSFNTKKMTRSVLCIDYNIIIQHRNSAPLGTLWDILAYRQSWVWISKKKIDIRILAFPLHWESESTLPSTSFLITGTLGTPSDLLSRPLWSACHVPGTSLSAMDILVNTTKMIIHDYQWTYWELPRRLVKPTSSCT